MLEREGGRNKAYYNRIKLPISIWHILELLSYSVFLATEKGGVGILFSSAFSGLSHLRTEVPVTQERKK